MSSASIQAAASQIPCESSRSGEDLAAPVAALPAGASVTFTDEIGHFENCNGPNPIPATPFGVDASGNPITCPAGDTEGFGSGTSPTDRDDDFCFPASEALRIHINGWRYRR